MMGREQVGRRGRGKGGELGLEGVAVVWGGTGQEHRVVSNVVCGVVGVMKVHSLWLYAA